MRYEKGRKESTRQRILSVASQQFRADGIAAVGLTGIMAQAGLTNGAFYAHFASKEDLVRETIVGALEDQEGELQAIGETEGGLEIAIRGYLNAHHRDNPGSGCASSSLIAEIGRQSEKTRSAYTDRLMLLTNLLAAKLPGGSGAATQSKAMAIFGLMVGTLQLARAVSDKILSDDILETGVQGALTLSRDK